MKDSENMKELDYVLYIKAPVQIKRNMEILILQVAGQEKREPNFWDLVHYMLLMAEERDVWMRGCPKEVLLTATTITAEAWRVKPTPTRFVVL